MAIKRIDKGIYINSGKTVLAVLGMAGTGTTTPNVVTEKKEVEVLQGSKKISVDTAYWGSDNKLPHLISTDVKGVTVIGSGLRKKIKIHYAQGLTIAKKDADGKLEEVLEGKAYEFFKKVRINKRLHAHITDLEWFQISFVEYILDNAGSAIVKPNILSAPYCRLSIQEKAKDEYNFDYFRSLWTIYSKQWAEEKVTEETSEAIHLVDSEWSAEYVKEYCKNKKITKFVRPVAIYMPETDYYPEPYWNSARESGWTDIAKLIPKVKKAIIQNSMTLKYIVKIPHDYFDKKYPAEKHKDRDVLIEEDLTALDEYLEDYENAGSSITTYYDTNKHTGQTSGEWKIEVVDNKIKDGVLTLDSATANSEILFAIGIDPGLIGTGIPGSTMGSNSGSDKRESFNIAVADAAVDREFSLEFIHFIAEFNGFDKENIYKYKNTILATTDKQPTGIEKKI